MILSIIHPGGSFPAEMSWRSWGQDGGVSAPVE